MTIQIDLSPELEEHLTVAAQVSEMPLGQYAGRLLQDALRPSTRPSGRLTPDELTEMIRQMAEGSNALPVLPHSVNDRASFYEDHA